MNGNKVVSLLIGLVIALSVYWGWEYFNPTDTGIDMGNNNMPGAENFGNGNMPMDGAFGSGDDMMGPRGGFGSGDNMMGGNIPGEFGSGDNMMEDRMNMDNLSTEEISQRFGIDADIISSGLEEGKTIREILEENGIQGPGNRGQAPVDMTGNTSDTAE